MATSGEIWWPPAGRNDGHQWGIKWPPVGRNRCPLTMEDGTPVEQIADILGHQSVESTGVYLKSSLGLLAKCALDPDRPAREGLAR